MFSVVVVAAVGAVCFVIVDCYNQHVQEKTGQPRTVIDVDGTTLRNYNELHRSNWRRAILLASVCLCFVAYSIDQVFSLDERVELIKQNEILLAKVDKYVKANKGWESYSYRVDADKASAARKAQDLLNIQLKKVSELESKIVALNNDVAFEVRNTNVWKAKAASLGYLESKPNTYHYGYNTVTVSVVNRREVKVNDTYYAYTRYYGNNWWYESRDGKRVGLSLKNSDVNDIISVSINGNTYFK